MRFQPSPKKEAIQFCGEDIYVQEWNMRQRLEIEAMANKDHTEVKDRFRELLLQCLFDASGNQINSDDLLELPFSQVEELLKHALTINGIGNDKVGELAKN